MSGTAEQIGTDIDGLLRDELLYVYFDGKQYLQNERIGPFRSALILGQTLLIAGVITALSAVAVSAAICVLNSVPVVADWWPLGPILAALAFTGLAVLYILPRGRTFLLLMACHRLNKEARLRPLTANDFVSANIFARVADGRASAQDLKLLLTSATIALWIYVLNDLHFDKLYQFNVWNVAVIADAFTLTVFNLTDRVGVTPQSPAWAVWLLQISVIASLGTSVVEVHSANVLGHKAIQGNRFRARQYFNRLRRLMRPFRAPEDAERHARFLKLTLSETGLVSKELSLAELDKEILDYGNILLAKLSATPAAKV